MSLIQEFQRVNRQRPCPVCNHADWCLVSRDDPSNPSRVICARVESAKRYGDAGWLHVLHDGDAWREAPRRRVATIEMDDGQRPDFPDMARRFRDALSEAALAGLALGLGVSAESLERLGVGWAGWGFSFPMSAADGTVRGVRVRKVDGAKLAMTGSREGLFLPEGLRAGGLLRRLLIAEGPSDTAALLDLGFDAVGRPSCTGATRLTAELVQRLAVPEAVIVADNDTPGLRGAEALASVLMAYAPAVRIVTPAEGVKDARAWKQAGATFEVIEQTIDKAPVRRLALATRKVR